MVGDSVLEKEIKIKENSFLAAVKIFFPLFLVSENFADLKLRVELLDKQREIKRCQELLTANRNHHISEIANWRKKVKELESKNAELLKLLYVLHHDFTVIHDVFYDRGCELKGDIREYVKKGEELYKEAMLEEE